MYSRRWIAVVGVAVLFGAFLAPQPVGAQSFSVPVGGFTASNVCANSNTPPAGCQVLTNGSPSNPQVTSAGALRLVRTAQNQHGSAWFYVQQPLASGFTTAFQFQISQTGCPFCSFPGDGIALVIQNDPAGTGALGYTGNGQNLSYGNNDVSTASGPHSAILNSLSIELDTYKNTDYGDPDANHIAVQSCGPNTGSTLSPNSADHNYICANGSPAKLALQSLPSGLSLSDGLTHTITVNYLPPGSCSSSCNNLSVYFDSTLILQTTVDLTQQLSIPNGAAYIGFTSSTGSFVENSDIISWSFSQWPLAPITINQPVQPTVTNFNYTSSLSAVTDYSQSGLPSSSFQGLFMQGTVTAITDQQFSDLVNNTPFQGSTCQHQDIGNGTFACVTTTDLCTTPSNSTPAGVNCLTTGTNPLISVSNTYNLDPSQKPIIAPGYIMGKDTAINCGAGADNTCKGLVSIFTGISGDSVASTGHTNNFNSVLIPILGGVQPSTSPTTTPALNGGWINGPVTLNLASIETVPSNNTNPPSTLPTISSINWQASGANVPSPASGTINSASGQVLIPGTAEGTTVITYAATDSSNVVETQVTNSGNTVSTGSPSFTIKTDLTPPTVTCTPPAAAWQAVDVVVPCTASDNTNGSGLAGPSSFTVQTNVPANTETNTATIPPVTVKDIAGNTSAPQPSTGSFGPFEVDKLAPSITSPTVSPAAPVFGQNVSVNYSCTDGGSGVVLCGPSGSAQIPPTANTGVISTPVDSTVGTHTFTINAQDLVGNKSTPASVTYTVGKASPVITWSNPAAISYGTPLTTTQLNAMASVGGSFVYVPGAGSVLGVGTQTLTANFTPSDTADYAPASKSVSLMVGQAASSTTITSATPNPAVPGSPVLVGYSVVGVAGGVSPTGTVTVTASTGEKCSAAVSAGGCSITFLSAGTRTVSASYSGDVNYLGSSSSTAIQVIVGDFKITATPSSETISSGHQAIYSITVTPVGGLTGSLNLSCSGAPPNSSCSVSPSVDHLQGKPLCSTVVLSSNKNVNHGTFTLTFTGTYANTTLVHSTSVTLTVKGSN